MINGYVAFCDCKSVSLFEHVNNIYTCVQVQMSLLQIYVIVTELFENA